MGWVSNSGDTVDETTKMGLFWGQRYCSFTQSLRVVTTAKLG